jgi:hypothetical protein
VNGFIKALAQLLRKPPAILPPPDRSTLRETTKINQHQLYVRRIERQG